MAPANALLCTLVGLNMRWNGLQYVVLVRVKEPNCPE